LQLTGKISIKLDSSLSLLLEYCCEMLSIYLAVTRIIYKITCKQSFAKKRNQKYQKIALLSLFQGEMSRSGCG